jgi:predicted dehydrogenase
MASDNSTAQRKLRWGFFTTGNIASANYKAISHATNAECVAVASRELAKAKEWAAARNESLITFGSYDEIIASSAVDAVYIPLPTALHVEWVKKAAAAGKHVLCDKPVAVSSAQLKEMLAACDAAGVQFMDGVFFMHHDRLRYIEKYIRPSADGVSAVALGPLRQVTSGFTFPADEAFRASNIRVQKSLEPFGCVGTCAACLFVAIYFVNLSHNFSFAGDLAWYCVRIALFAFNYDHPTHALAICHEATSDGVPLTASGTVFFSEGRVLHFDCGFSTCFRQWAEIAGSEGHLSLDDFCLAKSPESCSFKVVMHPGLADPRTKTTDVEVRDCRQDTRMFEDFSKLVLEGKRDSFWPRVALQTQLVCDAIMKSLENGSTKVAVEPLDY